MARARMASSMDGPSTAVMPIASRMAGKAISASFTRINPLSSVLKYPASAPINVPNTAFRATTENPMMTESCAPQITRDHRLRPKLSVPNAKSAPGGRNLKRIASLVGSTGAIHGARAAASRMMPNRPSPKRNSRWWNKRFSVAHAGCSRVKGISASNSSSAGPLSMAHPRVEQGVAYIHADIDQHKERRDEEQPALDHRIIPVQHCLRQQLAHAGNGEQRLRHHRAGYQQAHDNAHHRGDRDQRVGQRMLHHHEPPRQPFGTRRADIILPQHLQHGGARDARKQAHLEQGE